MDLKNLKVGSLAVTALTLLLTASSGVKAEDRDNNPPGAAGGAGTNWENPPGAAGGAGASPDRHWRKHRHFCENHPNHDSCKDRDNNPPGMAGGKGTNWENPPGPEGGHGASPDRRHHRDRDNNPPGAAGGAGTNWENPRGPRGGPGASPNRR